MEALLKILGFQMLNNKTIICLRVLQKFVSENGFRDKDHIFGVMIENDEKNPDRNGMIVYGPNNSENCQAFILGMKEVMIRNNDDSLEVTWVNIRTLLRKLEYEDLFQ